MGCHPPNLEAVAQAVFALQHFSIFAKLIIADFDKNNNNKNNNNNNKKPCKGVAKARGHALYPYTTYRVSPGHHGLNRLQADSLNVGLLEKL